MLFGLIQAIQGSRSGPHDPANGSPFSSPLATFRDRASGRPDAGAEGTADQGILDHFGRLVTGRRPGVLIASLDV